MSNDNQPFAPDFEAWCELTERAATDFDLRAAFEAGTKFSAPTPAAQSAGQEAVATIYVYETENTDPVIEDCNLPPGRHDLFAAPANGGDLAQRLADAEADVQRLHKDKMDGLVGRLKDMLVSMRMQSQWERADVIKQAIVAITFSAKVGGDDPTGRWAKLCETNREIIEQLQAQVERYKTRAAKVGGDERETLPDAPKRPEFIAGTVRFGACDHCGKREMCTPSGGNMICGGCADAAHLSDWIDYAGQLRTMIEGRAALSADGEDEREALSAEAIDAILLPLMNHVPQEGQAVERLNWYRSLIREGARAALSADGGDAAKHIEFLTSETDRLREALAYWQNRASELADGGEDTRRMNAIEGGIVLVRRLNPDSWLAKPIFGKTGKEYKTAREAIDAATTNRAEGE